MNQSRLPDFLVAALVGLMMYFAVTTVTPDPAPAPPPPAVPAPPPEPPKPKPHRPWAFSSLAAVVAESRGDVEPAVDVLSMPDILRKRNISAKGLGCCVFRSLDYASQWQNVPALHGMPEWMVQSGIEGGGYPGKVDKLIPQIAKDRGLPVPQYVQYEGKDMALIELALKTGRLPAITWGGNHMLNCPYLDDKQGAILDNNDPGRIRFFSRAEWNRRYMAGGGGWCVVLLNPGPTPTPRAASKVEGLFRKPICRQVANYRPPAPDVVGDFRWDYLSDAGQLALIRLDTGGQVGTYRIAEGLYFTKIGPGSNREDWSWEPSEPPVPLPDWALPGVSGWTPGHEGYTLCGRSVSRETALAALTDDSALPYLTVIGTPAERQQVLTDLDGPLAEFKRHFRVQAYDPSEWVVNGPWGFVVNGKPTIYVQTADGRVLHRQNDYAGGSATLAVALRKADPNYKPANDPNLSESDSPFKDIPLPAALVAGAAALVILSKKRTSDVA